MIRADFSLINRQQVEQALKDLAKRLEGRTRVLVGVPAAAGVYEDGITIATIAAVNEFGAANIKHKGGVSYGYKTEKDAEDGKVRFLKTGEGFMELGKTTAYEGSIPARPFLHPAIEKGAPQYLKAAEVLIPKVLKGELTMTNLLEQIGNLAEGHVKEEITNLKDPPNAKSTIAKKGSDNPLIDSGHMRQSIRYVIDDSGEQIEEGL